MSSNIKLLPDAPTSDEVKKYLIYSRDLLRHNLMASVIMIVNLTAVMFLLTAPFAIGYIAFFKLVVSTGSFVMHTMMLLCVGAGKMLTTLAPVWIVVVMNHMRSMDMGSKPPSLWSDLASFSRVFRTMSTPVMAMIVLILAGLLVLSSSISYETFSSKASEMYGLIGLSEFEQGIRLYVKAVITCFDLSFTAFLLPTIGVYLFYVLRFNFGEEGFLKSIQHLHGFGDTYESNGPYLRWLMPTIIIFMLLTNINYNLSNTDFYWVTLILGAIVTVTYSAFFYALCVDKIEGRKLEVRVKEKAFDGEAEAV